jgi:hypothetical protein
VTKANFTAATSNENRPPDDQLNCSDHDGVISLKEEASERGRSAIVDDLDSRRHFCCRA